MRTIIDGPKLLAPKHNLLDSGTNRRGEGDRWENGVAFSSHGCIPLNGFCTVCDDEMGDKPGPAECPEAAEFYPYTIQLQVAGNSAERGILRTLADEAAEVGLSSMLEEMAWAGCDGATNPTLSDGTYLGSGTAIVALGALMNQFIAVTGHTGAGGTIHMSSSTALYVSEHLREDDDGILRTKVGGHKVIVGAYPGNMIAGHLGDVDVYVSEPIITSSDDSITSANVDNYMVEYLAMAVWSTCAVWTAGVTGPGGGGGGGGGDNSLLLDQEG